VIRTQERVLLDDASADNVYSKDEYVRQKRSKSILCLPIVKQAKLVGALYLENNLTPGAFTPDRVTVLQLLASQAAISLENAALYSDLQLQVGLLQHLPVSAWTLKPDGTPDFVNQVWLEFSGQTLDFVRSHPEAWMTAVHPEDREAASKAFWEGVRGTGFRDGNPVSPRSGRDLSLASPTSRGLARCRRKSPQIRRYDHRHRRPEACRRDQPVDH
jgi:PAS domain-containing protein